ncbi:MAG: YfhL family 4Fe-4S dicluster ferredoxin [Ignavibacteriaceae bacterium]|nr:YfhL family 4Fe-4S dicluster ferredoxin [Ignavibacteriaceae bacterium]
MALMITKECIVCGACESECPNNAITAGKAIYKINPDLCTECVGYYNEPQCKTLCLIDKAIVVNPAYRETKAELFRKQRVIEKIKSYGML